MQPCEEHIFCGVHVLGEMYGIQAELLDDPDYLVALLRESVARSGATICDMQVKKFDPSGVTVLALLSESHASLHTYPEKGALFFDSFTCGLSCKPEKTAEHLIAVLKPSRLELQTLKRGENVR